jgi:hypothetical protein
MSKITEMLESSEKATAAPWTASGKQDNEYVEEGFIPAMIRHIYKDEQNRRVTEFLLTANTLPTLPSGENMQFIACARNAIPDIKRIVDWLPSVRHWEECQESAGVCFCGLSEIQSLIRR